MFKYVYGVLCTLSFLTSFFVFKKIPDDVIPSHFDFWGIANEYSPKIALFWFPAQIIFMCLSSYFLIMSGRLNKREISLSKVLCQFGCLLLLIYQVVSIVMRPKIENSFGIFHYSYFMISVFIVGLYSIFVFVRSAKNKKRRAN